MRENSEYFSLSRDVFTHSLEGGSFLPEDPLFLGAKTGARTSQADAGDSPKSQPVEL
jgi:hypothetical protein